MEVRVQGRDSLCMRWILEDMREAGHGWDTPDGLRAR